MKRTTALLLTLALCLSLMPGVACATNLKEEEMIELTEYTYDLAMTYIADHEWEGLTRRVDGVNATFWLPRELVKAEPTQESKEKGNLAYYISGEVMVQVSVANYGGITLEEYLQSVTDSGFIAPRIDPVNGVDFVIYDEPVKDCPLCRVAATVTSDGRFLEFIYMSVDEEFSDRIEASIATIRFED